MRINRGLKPTPTIMVSLREGPPLKSRSDFDDGSRGFQPTVSIHQTSASRSDAWTTRHAPAQASLRDASLIPPDWSVG